MIDDLQANQHNITTTANSLADAKITTTTTATEQALVSQQSATTTTPPEQNDDIEDLRTRQQEIASTYLNEKIIIARQLIKKVKKGMEECSGDTSIDISDKYDEIYANLTRSMLTFQTFIDNITSKPVSNKSQVESLFPESLIPHKSNRSRYNSNRSQFIENIYKMIKLANLIKHYREDSFYLPVTIDHTNQSITWSATSVTEEKTPAKENISLVSITNIFNRLSRQVGNINIQVSTVDYKPELYELRELKNATDACHEAEYELRELKNATDACHEAESDLLYLLSIKNRLHSLPKQLTLESIDSQSKPFVISLSTLIDIHNIVKHNLFSSFTNAGSVWFYAGIGSYSRTFIENCFKNHPLQGFQHKVLSYMFTDNIKPAVPAQLLLDTLKTRIKEHWSKVKNKTTASIIKEITDNRDAQIKLLQSQYDNDTKNLQSEDAKLLEAKMNLDIEIKNVQKSALEDILEVKTTSCSRPMVLNDELFHERTLTAAEIKHYQYQYTREISDIDQEIANIASQRQSLSDAKAVTQTTEPDQALVSQQSDGAEKQNPDVKTSSFTQKTSSDSDTKAITPTTAPKSHLHKPARNHSNQQYYDTGTGGYPQSAHFYRPNMPQNGMGRGGQLMPGPGMWGYPQSAHFYRPNMPQNGMGRGGQLMPGPVMGWFGTPMPGPGMGGYPQSAMGSPEMNFGQPMSGPGMGGYGQPMSGSGMGGYGQPMSGSGMGGHPPQVIDHSGIHYSNQQYYDTGIHYSNQQYYDTGMHYSNQQYSNTGMGGYPQSAMGSPEMNFGPPMPGPGMSPY